MIQLDNLSEEEIARRLAKSSAQNHPNPIQEFPQAWAPQNAPPRSAAVLILFIRQDMGWRLIFTRRNSKLLEHSGQVSFPGGRSDPDDISPEATALREAEEEIGLKPQDVRLLGRLPVYLTVTRYLVTPIVGRIPWPYLLSPADDEVSRLFTIPLSWLADPDNHETRLNPLIGHSKPLPVIYFRPYDGEVLWGASALFTLALIDALQKPG